MRRGDGRVDVAPPPHSVPSSVEGTAKIAAGGGGGEGGGSSSSVVVERSAMERSPVAATQKPRGKRKAPESTPEVDGASGASKPGGRRKWKKPKGKPKRPLSAYNLFFQREREKILRQTPSTTKPTAADSSSSTKPRRRRHRRTHGKIGFADLAKSIAEKWKALNDDDREEFEALAAVDKGRYKNELAVWNELQQTTREGAEQESSTAVVEREATFDNDDASTIARQQAGSLRFGPAFLASAAPPPTAFDVATVDRRQQLVGLPPWNLSDVQARLAARQTYLALRERMFGSIVNVGNGGTAEHLPPSVPANRWLSSRTGRNENFRSEQPPLMTPMDPRGGTLHNVPTIVIDEMQRAESTSSNLEAKICRRVS